MTIQLATIPAKARRCFVTRVSRTCQLLKVPISVQRLLPYIFVFVIGLVVFIPIMSVASTDHADFGIHSKIAEALPQEVTHVSHILYHARISIVAVLASHCR